MPRLLPMEKTALILHEIIRRYEKKLPPPSLEELAHLTRYKSKNSVKPHLALLQRYDLIDIRPTGTYRAYIPSDITIASQTAYHQVNIHLQTGGGRSER